MKHARGRRARARSGQPFGTVVIVPARNEERDIYLSLESLATQSSRPDLIIVVVNNSTDRTWDYACEFADTPGKPRTEVIAMEENPHKKAGALNAGIRFLQHLTGRRLDASACYVLVLDADSELHPEFLARAKRVLDLDKRLGGVSAACLGRRTPSRSVWMRMLTGMQKIEYGRYSSSRFRKDVHTMSGAGSFYRTEALQGLLDWRARCSGSTRRTSWRTTRRPSR